MKDNHSFSVRARLRSFSYAFKGLWNFFRKEHNAWIHLFVTIIVVALGLYLHVSSSDWMALSFAIGFVWAAELFNTAIEKMADHISPEQDARIGMIKDLAAGAVLVAAMVAVIVGCIVFIPKF